MAELVTSVPSALGVERTDALMFATLADFKVDVSRLREHFENSVQNEVATPYRDYRVDYLGWSVTSRDGSLDDGVKRISKADKNTKRGTTKTSICTGYLEEVIDELRSRELAIYRARIMQLVSNGEEMPFHRDAEKETWRLHIPIKTNSESYFEWRRSDGSVESVHLPADGSAYLVRVDLEHRAVNRSADPIDRVHLLMGVSPAPPRDSLTEPLLPADK